VYILPKLKLLEDILLVFSTSY